MKLKFADWDLVQGNLVDRAIILGDERCSLCGERATAEWHDDKVLSLCPVCATEKIPRLIGDAISFPRLKDEQIEILIQNIVSHIRNSIAYNQKY